MNKKHTLIVLLSSISLLAGYLCLWPVAITPQAWQAPSNAGFIGAFQPNNKLTGAELLVLGDFTGPEAVVATVEQGLYVSTHEGWILHAPNPEAALEPLISTAGRPLGLALDGFGNLYIADAYRGLLRFHPDSGLEVVADEFDGQKLGYVNDVAVSSHGRIYFTDSSAKFGARANGGTYPASLLDIMEHGGHGRLFSFDTPSQTLTEVAHGFNFANGVAVRDGTHESAETVFVNETGNYRVLAFELSDGIVQSQKTLIDNLPGFPDNLSLAADGSLWLGLVSSRSELLDKLSASPNLRKLVQRLPAIIRPKATHYGMVINMSPEGEVISQLQDPSGAIYTTTGATPWHQYLYVSRLHGTQLARLPLDGI
ncbi:SMP-30/gluconolactonase/LRE family protein [Simiduia curdlanivorans]|uniref:SMP-30/gluconolactonase/LRE family protein n=1 Tax=Simiduia curdlanivorans TaxID=1492769 RepID=A0ABV8V7C4_9GAMM|nr:SMP-30/gluconolactonase/LRE family protein [Simiduia curdlanivorans]MDN3639872.1 SMP-30/gluconolactonase/LRE family protein [Simiduia curdlanivorans]